MRRVRLIASSVATGTAAAVLVSGCQSHASSPPAAATGAIASADASAAGGGQGAVPVEANPPGDIPDNLAFVPYTDHQRGFTLSYPEGWTRMSSEGGVSFVDKLNAIIVQTESEPNAPSESWARSVEVPRLRRAGGAFELRSISTQRFAAGTAVLVVFRRNSAPDAVSGRRYRDEVQEYLFWRDGRLLRLQLSGVVGADNADAYRSICRSVRFL